MKIISFIFVLIFTFNSYAVSTIKLCASHEPPFIIFDKKNRTVDGIIFNALKELYDKVPEYRFEIVMMPHKRCSFEIALQDSIDGMAWVQKTPKYELIVDFPDTKFELNYKVWYKKGSKFDKAEVKSKEELLNYRMGIIRGLRDNEYLSYAITNGFLKITKVTSMKIVLNLLLSERVDFIYASEKTINWFKNSGDIKGVESLSSSKVLAKTTNFYISPLSREIKDKKVLKSLNLLD